MVREIPYELLTPDGVALEARLGLVPQASSGLVVCHPHPLYGGDMENPVVARAVEVAHGRGWSTLRFNFRGAGRSAGTHDGGAAEALDCEAALAALAARLAPPVSSGTSQAVSSGTSRAVSSGTSRAVSSATSGAVSPATSRARALALAGYSFGASVAAAVAAGRRDLSGVALIAPPLGVLGEAPYAGLETFPGPVLVALGTGDEFCPVDAGRTLAGRLPGGRFIEVSGASHFFFGKLFPLGEALGAWLDSLTER